MSDRICGAQKPSNTLVICHLPEGHEGKHRSKPVQYRSLFWDMRPKPQTAAAK